MPDNALTGKVPARKRDPRLDFFRGLSLLMIYINHIPGQFYENLTSRNIGFSDAAEGFVFMSGTAAAIAYGPRLKDGMNWQTLRKIWGRAWQLYLVHLFITVWALAIFAGGIHFLGANKLLLKNGLGTLFKQPIEFLLGTVTLTNQLSYVNILPLYSVLMLAAPFAILLALKRPKIALGLSVMVWALAGFFKINFPNYPLQGGWFLNPLSWQLIFMLGIMTGLNLRAGRRFVPVNLTLIIIAGLFLAFAAFDINSTQSQKVVGAAVVKLQAIGVPSFLVDFTKPFVSGPRLLHMMALAYILSLPWIVPKIAASRFTAPVRLIGKHGLPIFAAGTIMAFAAQAIKTAYETTFLQDTALILGGIIILYLFAYCREWLANNEREAMERSKQAKSKAEQGDISTPANSKVLSFDHKMAS